MTTTARPPAASAAVSTAVPGPTSATAVDAVTARTARTGPVDAQTPAAGAGRPLGGRARAGATRPAGGDRRPRPGLDVESYRDRVGEQMAALAANGTPAARLDRPRRLGRGRRRRHDVRDASARVTATLSLMVKAGVQWGLFGGALQALGTQRHHDALPRARSWTASCPAASP